MPLMIDQRVGPQEDGAKSQLLGAAPRFVDCVIHVEWRDHPGADQPLGVAGAEIVHPVVVGARDGGGELRLHALVDQGAQAAGRIEHREVDALDVHGFELHFRGPTAVGVVSKMCWLRWNFCPCRYRWSAWSCAPIPARLDRPDAGHARCDWSRRSARGGSFCRYSSPTNPAVP